jgi:hypothetical protein
VAVLFTSSAANQQAKEQDPTGIEIESCFGDIKHNMGFRALFSL